LFWPFVLERIKHLTVKAIQYSRLGGPEVLEYKDLPDPKPGPSEIVFRVKASAFNHLDIHFRRGLPGVPTPLPHIPGSDGAGIVEAVGSNVTNVKVGDRIVMNPGRSCGECEFCRQGEISFCSKHAVIGRETDGTYAELAKVPAHNAMPLPDGVPFDVAAAAPLVYLTAWSMVSTKAHVKKGDTVLVMAAGSGVSMAAIQMAKLAGATVIATTSSPEKAKLTKEKLGADHVLDYTKQEIDREVRALTNKRGVDVVIDHVGGDQWVKLLRATRNGGTVVTCGATQGFDPKTDLRQIFFRQVRVFGSTMGTDQELIEVMNLVYQGKLKPVIDRTFPLKDADEAHRYVESRKSFGKVLLIP
jgi:NADPH:quinone reductase-like Zn-dependent oxidoreductase